MSQHPEMSKEPEQGADGYGAPRLGWLRGVALVTSLELRQRVRSIRWYVALGIWLVVLLGLSAVQFVAMSYAMTGTVGGATTGAGRWVFDAGMMMLVLAMLLVTPAVSAGTINGDRRAGTLATLQATLLGPLQIVLGKTLAGWITGLAFLVAALPSIVPAAVLGRVDPVVAIRMLVAIALITLFVTAIGVGLSSLTQRSLGSVVLTYLVVIGSTAVLPIVYACTLPIFHQDAVVTVYETDYNSVDESQLGPDGSYDGQWRCVASTQHRRVVRTDIALGLLYVNPFVIVADQTARPDGFDVLTGAEDASALTAISSGMRMLSEPMHPANFNGCTSEDIGAPQNLGAPTGSPLWPWGLGAYLVCGAGAIALATWRLRIPMRRVGAGTRIA